MNKIILGVLLIISFTGSAQKVKKIRYHNKKTGFTEIYNVLKSNTSTKQGSYKEIYKGQIVLTGFYKDGLKDSLWIEYDPTSKHIFSRAFYIKGKVSGICEYYDQHGELAQKYDYTNRRLIYNKPMTGMSIYNADSFQPYYTLDPVYIGGDWAIYSFLLKVMRYPQHARDNNIQGNVLIRFVVDTDGVASDFEVVRGIDPELDREAVRVAKLIPNNWIPGKVNGFPVRAYFNLPIVFRLQVSIIFVN